MARKKGSRDRAARAKARSSYETYSAWYDKYTKGEKAGLYGDKLSKAEFDARYQEARSARLSNPARAVAMDQKLLSWDFLNKYKSLYGRYPTDIRDNEVRQRIATDFIETLRAAGMTQKDAREKFYEYFY